jgi:uncharacterized RDD family membrane protein YckC
MSERFGPIYATCDYAGFIRRSVALLLDGVILVAAWYVASYGWYYLAPAEWVTQRAYSLISAGWWLLSTVYVLGLRLTLRGTLGYRLVGIQYAYMLDEQPPWTALAFRATLAPVLLWFFALDHFWILVDKRKQAWHDKTTGFFVIKRGTQSIGQCRMVQRVIGFMLLTLTVWEPLAEER